MKILAAAALVLALSACAAPQPPASAPASAAAPGSTLATSTPAGKPATTDATQAVTLLPQYHWQLAQAHDKNGHAIDALLARPEKPLQLDFTAHGIAISNTCNRMRASYSTADNRIRIGALAATLMACPDSKLMALDKAASEYLSGTLEFSVDRGNAAPVLTLSTAQGDQLTFNGIPTAETRYGNAGVTVFLEVAPETKPCNHPLMPNAQCLEVRAVHYGANGIREGEPGPWQTLGQNIEGYTHEPGVRNVLRVQRYKVSNPPADASSVAYVLDMVIESALPPGKQP